MKHIAYIVHSLNLGGTERLAADMSIAFREQFDMHVLCLDEPGIWADQVRDRGIPVTSFYRQPGLDMRLPYKIAQYARANNIDILHAHQCTPWFYAGLSRLLYRTPRLLFEEHGRLYPEVLNKKRRYFNKFVIQHLTHRVVAVSNDVKQRLYTYEGVDLNRTRVIYNGTKPAPSLSGEDRQALRREFGFKDTDIVAGSVGRLDPIKNYPLLIKGVQKARTKNPDLKGIIIGDGPLMNDLQNQIHHLGMDNDFFLPGYRPDASELVGMMDIFVLPSFSEGTSMALIESMAAAIPSIVTNVGGNPEIVTDRETGWTVPSDNLDAFIHALSDASSEPRKRKLFGTQAQKRFLENFTFDIMIEKYKKLYEGI